ncbi:S8 family serine peptidase, partial [Novosphingobium sp. 1949]
MTKETGKGRSRWRMLAALAVLVGSVLAGPASAQLGVPGGASLPGGSLGGDVGEAIGSLADKTLEGAQDLGESASRATRSTLRRLIRLRDQRLARFVRETPGVERDAEGNPARAGELLMLDPDAPALESAKANGFTVIEQGALEGLDIAYARLAVPPGMTLADAEVRLRKALPGHAVSSDPIHFPSGKLGASEALGVAGAAAVSTSDLPRGGSVGVIDGGIAGSSRLVAQKGFASGAPVPDEHASAIASLLAGAGTARLWSADVYGTDRAGGDALAIARALGWMQTNGVPVVSISLVGPANPLLARAIDAARVKGMLVVAAVGNDGAAAPPAYPASYSGVVAVTGVDARGRVLIEAGQARHIDYAAPGADLSAMVPGKGRIALRGTSFAAPLAAARLA